MQVVLRIVNSKSNVRQLRLKSETTIIGRGAGCQLKVVSDQISRKHCQITVTANSVTIQDLGSANGTFVNGVQIEPRADVQLASGAQVRLGSLQFIVELQPNKSSAGGDGSSTILNAVGLAKSEVTSDIYTTVEITEPTAASSAIDLPTPSELTIAAGPRQLTAPSNPDLVPTAEVASPAEQTLVAETRPPKPDQQPEPPPEPKLEQESLQIVDFVATTDATAVTEGNPLTMSVTAPVDESPDIESIANQSHGKSSVPIEMTPFADSLPNSTSANSLSLAIVTDDSNSVLAVALNPVEPLALEMAPPELPVQPEETASGLLATNSESTDKLSTTPTDGKLDSATKTKSDQVQFEELMFDLTPLALLRSAADQKATREGAADSQTNRVSNTLTTPEGMQSVIAMATAAESAEAPPPIEFRPVKRALVPILGIQRTSQNSATDSSGAKPSKNEFLASASQAVALPRSGHLLGVACASNRIGYAVSNSDQTIASLIENSGQTETVDVYRVRKLVNDNHIVGLVLSLPPQKGGSETPKSLECRQLAETLSLQTGLPVTFAEDNSASRFAAQVMLQRFLEGRRTEKPKGPASTKILTEC